MNHYTLTYSSERIHRLRPTTSRFVLLFLLMPGLLTLFAQNQFLILPHALAQNTRKQQTIWLQPSPLLSTSLWHGNGNLPEVALTFDDGPQPDVTPQVLAILQRFNIKASFFCIGQWVKSYPNIVVQESQGGNLVEDHTWSHPNLSLLDAPTIHQQVAQGAQAIQQVTGAPPAFFRPPYGEDNTTVMAQIQQLDLSTVLWNVDPQDWAQPGVDTIVARVLQATGNGSIILLHDGGGNRAQTLAALPTIISTLQQRGLRFVTIQQMVDDAGSPDPQHSVNLSK